MTAAGDLVGLEILTVGHSTLTDDELLALLRAHRVAQVADVRRFPGSRRQPRFGREALAATLAGAGIEYAWLPALGGRRAPAADSPNLGWRNPSFRGYADHMDSAEFASGAAALVELARRRRTAMMCAEAAWWRCHRALIADHLSARGAAVLHLLDARRTLVHPGTAPARVVDGRLTYPGEMQLELAPRALQR